MLRLLERSAEKVEAGTDKSEPSSAGPSQTTRKRLIENCDPRRARFIGTSPSIGGFQAFPETAEFTTGHLLPEESPFCQRQCEL